MSVNASRPPVQSEQHTKVWLLALHRRTTYVVAVRQIARLAKDAGFLHNQQLGERRGGVSGSRTGVGLGRRGLGPRQPSAGCGGDTATQHRVALTHLFPHRNSRSSVEHKHVLRVFNPNTVWQSVFLGRINSERHRATLGVVRGAVTQRSDEEKQSWSLQHARASRCRCSAGTRCQVSWSRHCDAPR